MRERVVGAIALLLLAASVAAAEVQVPAPRGWVTDEAGVLSPAEEARLTARIEALRAKTGAEIAVVTVRTTAPLDDFSYAMKLAETWKPGRKDRDTGVVFLVATEDRKLRVLVGYGLEFEVCWVVPADHLDPAAGLSPRPLPLDLDREIAAYGAATAGGR